jgi:hypothetical protein
VERGVPWRTLWQIAGMSMGTQLVVSALGRQATTRVPQLMGMRGLGCR